MKIVHARLSDCGRKTKRALLYATFSNGHLRRYMRVFPDSRIIIIYRRRQIMGWAFALPFGRSVSLSLYVNQRYRRRGVATALIHQALRRHRRIVLTEWDGATKQFFQRLRRAYPKRIWVVDWPAVRPKFNHLLEQAQRKTA